LHAWQQTLLSWAIRTATLQTTVFKRANGAIPRMKFGFSEYRVANVNVNDRIYSRLTNDLVTAFLFFGTTGLTDVLKLNTYLSYVDTLAIVPHQFVYNAREGDYKRDKIFTSNIRKQRLLKTEEIFQYLNIVRT
jgi:hypothetical protein